MSERWIGDKLARSWESPIGFVEVFLCADRSFAVSLGGTERVPLKLKTWKAVLRAAERIIAARCRETLKLLGEE